MASKLGWRCAEREKVVVVPWGLARGDDDELQHNKLGLD
jgi:hypothetical protein